MILWVIEYKSNADTGYITIFFIAALFLLYAKLEEDHGLARHAMAVYERATQAVPPEEQFEVSPSTINPRINQEIWHNKFKNKLNLVHLKKLNLY